MVDETHQNSTNGDEHLQISGQWRLAISGLLIVHLAAVVLPPMAAQTRPSPPVIFAFETLRWYIDALYLDHGYAFFAPDPGPSNLVEYILEFDDDREPVIQTFPDIDRHWPRLLYHRHFMLSEHLNDAFMFPRAPSEPQRTSEQTTQQYNEIRDMWKVDVELWEKRRKLYEMRWRAFEQHLLAKYDADGITMKRKRHLLPQLPIRGEINLHDERSYQYAGRDELFPDPLAGVVQ